jgi:hypothetical protein
MPDTKIRLPGITSGWTVYTRLKNEAGLIWDTTTSTFATYVVGSVANYALATPEMPATSGDYEATMPAGAAAGNYTWAHYRRVGGAAALSDPIVGSGSGTWDGTGFSTGGGGGATDTIPVVDIVVQDSAPTAATFVIAMDDASPVPATFVWRGSVAIFAEASATLPGGKFPITTYTRLTTTTARLTFTPALPVAPANGEAIQVL